MTKTEILTPTPAVPKKPASEAVSAPTKVCLLVVFNHRYDGNLPKLDEIYRSRFEHVRYLVPFYDGDRADVYPVYYSSYQFQGYFRTAWEKLRNEGFTHYCFCADDVFINPAINGANLLSYLGLNDDSGYIIHLDPITDGVTSWFPLLSALVAVAGKNGVNWEQELPEPALAAANLAAKGYPMGRFGWHNLKQGIRAKAFFQTIFYFALRFRLWMRDHHTDLLAAPYPLVFSNADFMIIPAQHMEKFVTYCSVFAAMGVFVEVAAPTALLLCCPHVLRWADTAHSGRFLWPSEEKHDEYCRQFDYRIDRLLANFEKDCLCLHPIKLSKWRFSSEDKRLP